MIEVAAGVVTDARGRVLLQQRLPGKHLAGMWEFPGGKLEAGESVEQALARELDEELGIEVLATAPLIALPWAYPEKTVHLHALRVTVWRGELRAREGNPLHWVAPTGLDAAVMPPADVAIVTALRLPALYRIAETAMGSGAFSVRAFLDVASRANNEPDPILVELRMPGAGRAEVRTVAQRMLAADPPLQGRLLLNHDIELARELGVGVHLKSAQMSELQARPLHARQWVAASCHSAADLALATHLGVDFATLSPVCKTASHPDAAPLGWERFAQIVAGACLPVYALGGVGPGDLARARAAGAQGVAGIRGFR